MQEERALCPGIQSLQFAPDSFGQVERKSDHVEMPSMTNATDTTARPREDKTARGYQFTRLFHGSFFYGQK
jgi:hypothetical protein